ncbi:MAG: hypothetical protein ACTSRC_13490 [Candidatus Helarchaeota archaeon]
MDEKEWMKLVFTSCPYFRKKSGQYYHCSHPERRGGPCKFELCPLKYYFRDLDKKQKLISSFFD